MLQTNDISTLGAEIKSLINNDRTSALKRKMFDGVRYYDSQHDILKTRMFFFDSNGQLREEEYRANTKISHGFFTELVDQKVQYLLSNPVEFETENLELQDYLEQYIDDDFQLMLQELVEGASQKSYEYAFWNVDENGKIKFKAADALKTIPIYDENLAIDQMIYYYDDQITIKNEVKNVVRAQFWTKEQVFYFVCVDEGEMELDESIKMNPAFHQLAKDEEGTYYGKGYGQVPFIKLANNKREKTDLEPIKDLIDDYDLMACSLSNNLIDFDHPIYIVRGFEGDNLDSLVTNLKSKKTVGVGEGGGIDVQTVDIPVEARKTKLAIDKEGIYKFGMGFDSSQTGDGNITNIVIKSRYSLLDLKCNKTEVRLRAVIKQILDLIVQNINELNKKTFDSSDIEVTITRSVMANETDNATVAKTEADTKQVLINNVMTAAPRLDDRTVLELLAEILEIDPDEVEKALGEQVYKSDFNQTTEVDDDETEPISTGNRESAGEGGQED